MAMVMRRRAPFARRPFTGRRSSRRVEWVRNNFTPITINFGETGFFDLVREVEFERYVQPTVIRIIGDLFVSATDITLGTQAIGAAGISVVEPTEVVPDPQDINLRNGNTWMWWQAIMLQGLADPDNAEDQVNYRTYHFDVRAMRKVPARGSNLTLSVGNLNDPVAMPLNVVCGASVLLKE